MSKQIIITDCHGGTHTYNSSLTRGYHAVQARDGVCIVEKRLFSKPEAVACYPSKCDTSRKVVVEKKDCGICSKVNPTQQPPYQPRVYQ